MHEEPLHLIPKHLRSKFEDMLSIKIEGDLCPVCKYKLLHELGIQFNQSGTWLLYSKFQDKGYTHIEPFDYEDKNGNRQVKTRMKWTQKGHIFLYETLKKNNYLPMIEREQTA